MLKGEDMPKKTRRQKALAKQRKIDFLLRKTSPSEPEPQAEMTVTTVKTDQVSSTVTYFASDLRRSLLYVSLIITLEIIVYFATINRYLGN